MSAHESGTVEEAARRWVIRIRDASFADWDAFADWLERDPAHLGAYDAALDDDIWAEDLFRSAPPIAVPDVPASPRRRWAASGAIAAALVAVVGGWAAFDRGSPAREVATRPGEHRTVALADGSKMVLNGNTRVVFAARAPRAVTLLAGEALFEVRHNPQAPFVVTVGETRLVDAGTVFNVIREGGALDVAVARGAVIYAPGKDAIRLDAGAGLSRASAGAVPIVRKANPDSVGSWQVGQLRYDDAPLARIGRDLSRNIGEPIRASGPTGDMRFTGTLVLKGSSEQVLGRAGPLLGVRFTRGKEGWTMAPTDAAPH